jgi:superfamily II DNA/RNA helicase
MDLVEQGAVRLDAVQIAVIDEADRLADMGFLPQVRKLLDLVPDNRQTILFSATLEGDIGVLTHQYQRDPARHEVGEVEPDVTAATHSFVQMDASHRSGHTATLIKDHGPTIVFCRTRHGADRLVKQLGQAGVHSVSIHGGRSQGQRDRALQSFKRGEVRALVATDVAARGIHVDGVACVVHFDLPEDAKAYLHRSGRTARAGASGVVVTLVPDGLAHDARRLQRDVGLPIEIKRTGRAPAREPRPQVTSRPGRPHHRAAAGANRRRQRR